MIIKLAGGFLAATIAAAVVVGGAAAAITHSIGPALPSGMSDEVAVVSGIPARYLRLYQAAARSCPGLP